jgi:hypothetical protein
MSTPNKTKLAAVDTSKQAFTECLHAVAHDMPMLMHGSGDVQPHKVDPESVQLLSELTTHYISNLVQAAVDAHQILNGGPQPLPPPPLKSMDHLKPPLPTPPVDTTTTSSSKKEKTIHRKRRRATDEFWDEPLPEPKIKGKTQSKESKPKPTFQGVPVDDWVGVAGVDFWESSRARKAHVGRAITTQSFIFPICHDVGLYGRVLEVQTARRSIAPTLVDPVIMEVVRTEGASQGPGALRKRDKPSTSKNEEETEEPEDTDSEGEDGATWPGLEYLLPVHVLKDFGK